MKALAAALALVVGLAGVIALWLLTTPGRLDPAIAAEMEKPGDAKAGEIMFHVGGCSACHAKPDDPTKLGGGLELKTPFGSIFTPNISPDPDDGIGSWSPRDFATAIYEGVDPHGQFEYPAFPYPSYRNMAVADVRDLWAFLRTLPAVKGKPLPPQFRFPFNIRRAIGVWQSVYLPRVSPPDIVQPAKTTAYGRYLVEGPGHCAECHTPRDYLGGLIRSRALSGAPMPSGKGKAPNITPAGLKDWSVDDVNTALTLGLTPDGDSLGGEMAEVVRNLSKAPKDDVEEIARYLKEGR